MRVPFLAILPIVAAFPICAADDTFASIAPLLEQRCISCHQRGEIAPMPFTTYAETRPWAKSIRAAVLRRSMPPWHADPAASTHIANSRALTQAEIDRLVSWVDRDAPEGARLSAPLKTAPRTNGWRLGKPDLIVRVPGFEIPASGTIEYTFLITPTQISEDKWIRAAEWRIDKRNVVHHMNAFVRPPGSSYLGEGPTGKPFVATKSQRGARRPDEAETDRRELLLGYEPGYEPIPWTNGRAKFLRKGSDIVFEMHYTANGKPATDYSELGIYFTTEPPRERVLTINPADSKFAIPPGDGAYISRATATFQQDVELISLQPHMHLRGKAYVISVRYPDGKTQPLLTVPRYDFNWQTTYFLVKPLRLPKGTVLEYTATFDNSANNPHNPDPTKTIQWGDQSWEEMNIGFTEVAFPARADPNIAVLSDTSKPAPTASTLQR